MNKFKLFFAASFALMALGSVEVCAQNPDNEFHSTVHVSFFPPLSTNGRQAQYYSNDFSFSLLAGVSKNEEAFAFAGLANLIRNDAAGFQFAGLANYTGNEGSGFQFAGLSNVVCGDFKGIQFSGLVNAAGRVEGFQFAGLGNVAGRVEGFQFAGLGNVAEDVDGFQFGGLFNKARNVNGIQFAGLLNIADHSDYSIGLVNIIKDGEMGVAVGYNEIGTVSLTFRSGGRVLYGILGLGYNHQVERSKDAMTAVGGFGAHIPIAPWLRINNELTIESIDTFSCEESNTFRAGYALLPAFRIGRHFEIFGGPSLNYMQSEDPKMYDLFPSHSLWERERASGLRQQLHIGWQAGVQFLF